MKIENQIDFDRVKKLYMDWYNEGDPFKQREKLEEIRAKVSPYELLMYSTRFISPFKAFKNIFSLDDLFNTLEEMQKRGEDIGHITNMGLVIKDIEDIQSLSRLSKKEMPAEISNINLIFNGSKVFKYGDAKSIGNKFKNTFVNRLNLEQIEELMKSQQDYKGIPIKIDIDNIGELPLDKLSEIEKRFDIDGIKIVEKDKEGREHQGEQIPLNLKTYKQVRTIADEIISELYVEQDKNETITDFHLATQIIDKIVNRVEYDKNAPSKEKFSEEVINASSMVGLITGKAICQGYAEILRNVLSCVNIECKVVEGEGTKEPHAWNQVKIGDKWYNVDITYAREDIINGEPSGDLFVSDEVFYGDRRKTIFDRGKQINKLNLETSVINGGHKNIHRQAKTCKESMSPAITLKVIEQTRKCDDYYKKEGKSADYKGPIPYVGSNIEKMRSNSKNIDTPQH